MCVLRELFKVCALVDFCLALHNQGCCYGDHDKCRCLGIPTSFPKFFVLDSLGLSSEQITQLQCRCSYS